MCIPPLDFLLPPEQFSRNLLDRDMQLRVFTVSSKVIVIRDRIGKFTRSAVEVGERHDDGGVDAALEVPRAVRVAGRATILV